MNNASFQQVMNTVPSHGIAGQKTFTNPIVYYCKALKAKNELPCACFVWLSSGQDEGDFVVNTGTSKPLGLSMPLGLYANNDLLSSASNKIAESNYLNVCIKGDLIVVAQNEASQGEKVFANLSDGSIKTGSAEAEIEGYIETDYLVVTGGSVGQGITISNWLS